MVQIKQRFDSDDHYKGGNTKEYIVIHDTGNYTDSDEGNANYFCTGSRNSSAHYFVDDDSITQIVMDDDCSWHCGDGGGAYGIGNRNSIGIEQCRVNGVVTDRTKNNTLELVAMLMKKYGIPESKVVRHYDASRKNCPASFNLDGKWTRWFQFKNELHNLVTGGSVTPITSTGGLLRVRLSWSNARSQKGAYTVLQNAIDCAKANVGYRVYDSNGYQVYPKLVVSIPVAPQTIYNVAYLQSYIGAVVDNIAGTRTLGLCPLLKVGSTGNVVRFLQSKVGAVVDGAFGYETKALVIRFQINSGLVVDGIVGKNTWRKLLGL